MEGADVLNTSDYLADQRAIQALLREPLPHPRGEQRELAQRYAMYLVDEVFEYLRAIAYKHHIPRQEASRAERVAELIDIQRYLYCLALIEGVDAEEWEEAFKAKGRVIGLRAHRKAIDGSVVTLDIDGVLARYADWGDEAGFVERGRALEIEPMPGAAAFVRWIRAQGWIPVAVTSRKRTRFPRLEADTLQWLKDHSIDVADVLWGYDKAEAVSGLDLICHVDDSAKHALNMAPLATVFKMPHTGPNQLLNFEGRPPEGIIAVERLSDIAYHLIERLDAAWTADLNEVWIEEGIWPRA